MLLSGVHIHWSENFCSEFWNKTDKIYYSCNFRTFDTLLINHKIEICNQSIISLTKPTNCQLELKLGSSLLDTRIRPGFSPHFLKVSLPSCSSGTIVYPAAVRVPHILSSCIWGTTQSTQQQLGYHSLPSCRWGISLPNCI